jgi:hypothetical protein
MNRLLLLLAPVLVLAACAPLTAAAPTPTQAAPPATPTAAPQVTGERRIVHSSSLYLIVDDPAAAMAELERAVQDLGGFVVSASYYASADYPGYASLNAKVPPEALPELRQAALELALAIQSDNLYTQDVTAEYRHLLERSVALEHSEARLWDLVTQTEDAALAESLTLLRELVRTEQESIRGQLVSLEDRALYASVDVTLNEPSLTPAPLFQE